MKKGILCVVVLFLCLGCSNLLLNSVLEAKGVYKDKLDLYEVNKENSSVVFLPMHHIGTEPFYTDVRNKVDSLKNQGYYFYLEQVDGDKKKDTIARKYRKISGLPFVKAGYTETLDSILGKKFKARKEIVNQPSYKDLGIDSVSSKRVDVDFDFIVNYYEDNYGDIILEPCDFETTFYEKTICDDKKSIMTKEIRQDVITNSRNQVVINQIIADSTLSKIAIIYGEDHYTGIKEGLLKEGYIEN